MKKIVLLIAIAAAALAVSCNKEKTPQYEQPKKLALTSYQLDYSPLASEGQVVVDTKDAITATTDRSWCTVSVSGNTVTLRLTENFSKLNRYAVLSLQAGDASLDLSVIQYGEILSGLGTLSDITAPVGGDVIEVPVKLNIPVTFETSESWIHPVLAEDEIVITVDPNPNPATRLGTVSYSAGSANGSFNVTQYPELKKPDDWVITPGEVVFKYPDFSTSASMSVGDGQMYVLFLVPKGQIEGNVDDWIFEKLAVQTRNEILAQVEANPGAQFKDYLLQGTETKTFSKPPIGENYLIALGFGENSYVSGLYQYKAVTITDIRPAYFKWEGKWKVSGRTTAYGSTTFAGEETWTIAVDPNNLEKSLILKGCNSITNSTVAAVNGTDLKLNYLSDGSIQLAIQKSDTFEYPSLGPCYMQLYGYYSKNGGSSYTRVSAAGSVLFTAALTEDGNSINLTVGTRASGGVDYDYEAFCFYMVDSAGSRYSLTPNSGALPLPFEMTRLE